MLEKITSIEEFKSKAPTIDWDTITHKERNELPTFELGRISDGLNVKDSEQEILTMKEGIVVWDWRPSKTEKM